MSTDQKFNICGDRPVVFIPPEQHPFSYRPKTELLETHSATVAQSNIKNSSQAAQSLPFDSDQQKLEVC